MTTRGKEEEQPVLTGRQTLDLFEVMNVPIEELPIDKRKSPRPCYVKPPDKISGEELVAIRSEYKLSQNTMAKLIGCQRTALSHWEHGKHEIPDMAARIIGLFRDDPGYFFKRGIIREEK